MALTIDGAAVLRAVAENPDAFPAVKADLEEIARKLLIKQIKAKTTDKTILQKILGATSEDILQNVLDSLSPNDLAGLIKRIDQHSALVKATTDQQVARRHIIAIANGQAEVSAVPEKPAKPAKKPAKIAEKPEASKIGTILDSKVHSGKPRATRAKKAG